MAGYSKESKRQNNALQAILRGETPEKRILIPVEDLEFKEGIRKKREEDRKRSEERMDLFKEFRTPWFCPECNKIMKQKLDDKMWRLYGHCFDCQVKIETKMRIDGIYDEWAGKKVNANKLAWIIEQKQSIEEFKKQKAPEFLQQFRPDGYSVDKEKWQMDVGEIKKQADEALEYLQKIEDSLK